jgi:hypothetical protein
MLSLHIFNRVHHYTHFRFITYCVTWLQELVISLSSNRISSIPGTNILHFNEYRDFSVHYNIYVHYNTYVHYNIYVYSTICKHACFGILYASSVQLIVHVRSYLYHKSLLLPRHVVQHKNINASRHAQNEMGPECSNDHMGSELCIAQQHRCELYTCI